MPRFDASVPNFYALPAPQCLDGPGAVRRGCSLFCCSRPPPTPGCCSAARQAHRALLFLSSVSLFPSLRECHLLSFLTNFPSSSSVPMLPTTDALQPSPHIHHDMSILFPALPKPDERRLLLHLCDAQACCCEHECQAAVRCMQLLIATDARAMGWLSIRSLRSAAAAGWGADSVGACRPAAIALRCAVAVAG